MKRTGLALGLLLLATTACASSSTEAEPQDRIALSSGTSFGFCRSYCYTELVVDSTTVRFTETGRDSVQFPPKTRQQDLTRADWQRIRALANPATLATVEGVNGCPDCADGGAEWIEIRTAQDSIRSTFEFGKTLTPIAALQAEIRALRERFPR